MEFKHKIAVVTGAARGIGLAVCQALVAEGCKVVIVDINAEAAEQAAEAIRQSGGEALALACDATVEGIPGAVTVSGSQAGSIFSAASLL